MTQNDKRDYELTLNKNDRGVSMIFDSENESHLESKSFAKFRRTPNHWTRL